MACKLWGCVKPVLAYIIQVSAALPHNNFPHLLMATSLVGQCDTHPDNISQYRLHTPP